MTGAEGRTQTRTPCPSCGYEFLHIENRLVAKPVGTFSLAGAVPKVSAYEWPHVVCDGCGISAPAKGTDDARLTAHAPTCRSFEQSDDGTLSCECGASDDARTYPPGCYRPAEHPSHCPVHSDPTDAEAQGGGVTGGSRTPAGESLPLNVACLNGAHDRCDGISTHPEGWLPGSWPAPECPCPCHYSSADDAST